MRILVVGDGKVGHTVAEQLTREGHDVVIIDKNEDVLQRCEDTLDVLCIRGNGANARGTQKEVKTVGRVRPIRTEEPILWMMMKFMQERGWLE